MKKASKIPEEKGECMFKGATNRNAAKKKKSLNQEEK